MAKGSGRTYQGEWVMLTEAGKEKFALSARLELEARRAVLPPAK